MGHWHGEISSNVTFAYCTKGCINVAVLRDRPLTHVDANPKFIYRTFPFFFLHENSQSGCIKGKKVRCFRPLLLFSLFLVARARSFLRKYQKKKKTSFEIDQAAAARPRPVTLASACKLHDTTIENHKADENQGRATFRWWHGRRK